MKKNKTKKLYDITFLQYCKTNNDSYATNSVMHTTDKAQIKHIIKRVIQNGYDTAFRFYKTGSVKIKSHNLVEIDGGNFISQDTKDLGEYTVIYPDEKFNPNDEAYANKNVIDLNLKLIQKEKQR